MIRRVRNPLLFSILVAVSALCCGGCGTDSAQRIALAEAVVQNATAAVKLAGEQVTALRSQLEAAQTAGANSASLAAIRTALDDAMSRKPQLDAFLASAQANLERAQANPTVGTEVETYISLGVAALGFILTGVYRRKAGRSLAATTDIVQAVEGLPDEVQTQVKAAVASTMAKASPSNAVVDAIKKG